MRGHDAQEAYDHVTMLAPNSPFGPAGRHTADAWRRHHRFPPALAALPRGTRRRESHSAQTIGALPSAPRQTQACDERHAFYPGLAVSLVRLATSLGHRSTRDIFSLVPPARWSGVVLEIPARTAPNPDGVASAHPPDGARQSHLGSAADRQRTAAQARPASLPTHVDRTPGHRAMSQRWRTFVRNHVWDLITRGVSVDFILGAQALSVRLIQFSQRWWRHAVSNAGQGTPQGHAAAMPLLRGTMSVLVAWSAGTGEVISVDQRSPPDGSPSCSHDPGLATRATLIDRFDVCPAGVVLCWWNRASPHIRGARPLSQGVSRVVPGRRAA